MKKFSLTILIAALPLVVSGAAAAQPSTQLSKVCRRITLLQAPILWKAEASGHIQDRRSQSSSLIFGMAYRYAPPVDCVLAYDGNGKVIHKLGCYAKNGDAYRARYYGGWGCGDAKSPARIQAAAKRARGDLYLKIAPGQCLRVPRKGITGRVGGVY